VGKLDIFMVVLLYQLLSMKVYLKKEKKDLYYGEIIWEQGVYAQGSTPEQVVEYLCDIYQQIQGIKKWYNL
jgi:hypothetical protein